MIKILILGASGSGKTTALKHINNDENISIILFDYGKATIGETTTYLFSSPGIEGFRSINEILSPDVDGIIIVIDSTIGTTETDKEIMNIIHKKHIPYVIFANKQDLSSSNLQIDFDALIMPTIATEGIGINDGLKMLLKLIGNNVKPDTTQKNTTTKSISSSEYIEPEREFKDIIKSIKSAGKQNSQKPDFRDIIKNFKPLPNKDVKMAEICKLKILMHPIELENVKKVLENSGFSNITVIEVRYVDNQYNKETYRASRYNIYIPQKVQVNMIIKREDVKYVIQAIESIKTEDIIDDIFISPIENVVRIRTEEKGEEAIE